MTYISALVLLFVTCVAAPAFAVTPEMKAYQIDPAHSRVIFTVSHLGFIQMPGHAQGITGKIGFNFKNAAASSVDLSIDAKQLGMDFPALDRKIQGPEFFNSEKFPAMHFKATQIDQTSIDTAQMTGDFTLLGVTRPVTLAVKFNGRHWNKFAGVESAGFSATGMLRRSDFGMKAYLPDVGDQVTLGIEVEADEIRTDRGY